MEKTIALKPDFVFDRDETLIALRDTFGEVDILPGMARDMDNYTLGDLGISVSVEYGDHHGYGIFGTLIKIYGSEKNLNVLGIEGKLASSIK